MVGFSESDDVKALRRFLEREVPPELAAKWDAEDLIPRAMLGRLAELGACGLTVPEEYAGLGRDIVVMPIWGGSSAIQRNNISNLMGLPRK